jgi:gas vesicle protein GvpL/GvpF
MPNHSAVYLYCVVSSARRPAVARAPEGLAGATRPEAHEAGRGLWVIVAEAPLAEYGPGNLEPKLQDLDWVAATAVAHEAVVEHFSRLSTATVIPAKLFTLFSSLDKAIADVASRRASIARVMKRIAGSEEWGVRVTRRPGAAAAAHGAASPTSGAAFLAARKAARDATANARSLAAAAAEKAYLALARHAREARARERRPEPGTNPPVLEAAFLVRASARSRFKSEARRQAAACAAAGADLALTGPWPAYNFVGDPA